MTPEYWSAQTTNRDGEWVPAIPEPYFGVFYAGCLCGKRFLTIRGYRGHYALSHILKLDDK